MSTSDTNSTSHENVLSTLKTALPDKILLPDDPAFQEPNNAYFSVFSRQLQPLAVALPTSAAEVSALVKALNPLLKQGIVRIAIKGTGHTPIANSANIQDGVTIHLSGLKGIKLNEDKSLVEIGVGETWGSVYEELEKYGLTTAGGRVARVGVGGLVLGGGLSLYSSRRGFPCDSVTDFEVVLASGEIVHANQDEHSDLWIALKGGLNNFGIVTAFTMRIFKSNNVWGGIAVFAPESWDQIMEAVVDFVLNEKDEDTHIICSTGYGFGRRANSCCLYHTEGTEDAPSLQRFTKIPGMVKEYSSLRTSTPKDFYEQLSNHTLDWERTFWTTFTIKPDILLMQDIYTLWKNALDSLKDVEGLTFTMGFFPFTKALLVNSQKTGGNAMNIDPEDGPLLGILINVKWTSETDDERSHIAVKAFMVKARALANEKGMLHRYIFANYAYKTDDVFKGYGEKSLEMLRETSRKYDSSGIFQKAVPGGFKLGEAE